MSIAPLEAIVAIGTLWPLVREMDFACPELRVKSAPWIKFMEKPGEPEDCLKEETKMRTSHLCGWRRLSLPVLVALQLTGLLDWPVVAAEPRRTVRIDRRITAPAEGLAYREDVAPTPSAAANVENARKDDAAPPTPMPESSLPVVASPEGNQVIPPAPVNGSTEFQADVPVGGGMTLESVIALADANHPKLVTAFQQIQSFQGLSLQAGLYPNPVVGTGGPQVGSSSNQYNAFIAQDIVTANKLGLSRAGVEREVQQAQYNYTLTRFAVITPLRQRFYQALTAQRRVDVLKRLVLISTVSRDVANRLFDAGEGTRGDSLLLDIELDKASLALNNSEIALRAALKQVAIAAGVADLQINRLSGDLESDLPIYDLDHLRAEVAYLNSATGIANSAVERDSFRLERAIVEPIPNVNVMAGYQNQTGPSENQMIYQLAMIVPLWNKNQGNILSAQANLAASRADVERVLLDLAERTTFSYNTFLAAEQRVTQYESRILPKARETLEVTQQLYSQGQIDFLRLLQAQRTLLEAELARIDSQEVRWTSAADIAGLLQLEQWP
jgi:outer membrane protein, heavy metal efflux system